ncbi:MAG TPA: WD40 repeat domain-containing protein [Pyrinomonadaceae bacterium]|nr:WD40 repeat domain-containing protein [Pyrinomonadaceae bacterium]
MRTHLIFSVLIVGLCTLFVECHMTGASKDKLLKTISIHGVVTVAAFSPNGEILATVDRTNLSSGKYRINVWDTSDGRLRYVTEEYSVYGLAFSPDGSMFAASCRDGVRLFRLTDGQLLRTLAGNQLFSVAFSPDGQTLASGGAEGEVRTWRVADGTLLHTFLLNKHVTTVSFSVDGKLLAAGSSETIGFVRPEDTSMGENPIALWQLSDNKLLTTLPGHKHGVLRLAFSPDGQTLVSGGSDGLLKVWNLGTKSQLKIISLGHDSTNSNIRPVNVNDLAFSADGRLLAVAANNGIYVLRSSDFNTTFTLKAHTDEVLNLHFRDDTTLLSSSEDNSIKLWQL